MTIWSNDLEAAGYRPYTDSTLAKHADYCGSWQKRVRDAEGTRYFINFNLLDMTVYGSHGRRIASSEVQFHVGNDAGDLVDVKPSINGDIHAYETFFSEMWEKMGYGYYEKD